MTISLKGRCILLTRSLSQSQKTAEVVMSSGGRAMILPCMVRVCLNERIKQGWARLVLSHNAWVLFTSVNAIECVESVVGSSFVSILKKHHVLAVGERTAEYLHSLGLSGVFVPKEHSQEGLLTMLLQSDLPQTLFFFRAEKGRDYLHQELKKRSVNVVLIYSYRMCCPQSDTTEVVQALQRNEVDAVLLGSPQTVRHYLRRIADVDIANRAVLVAISSRVADTAKTLGLEITLVSKQANFSSMLETLHHFFEGENQT